MERKDYTLNQVERMVCQTVNDAMDTFYPDIAARACHESLYKGVSNIPMARRVARGVCFCLLHDRFALSYGVLSFRSGISRRNVIRSSSMIRNTPVDDKFMNMIESGINRRINEELF